MKTKLDFLKGIHPGFVLERELQKRNIRKGQFALQIHEYPQTITAISKGKRGMNTPLALKIEDALDLEEGFLMTLQIYYEIEMEKRKQQKKRHPDLSIIRPILFWDTKLEKLQWQRQKKAIIKRVFERGNEAERKEITRFYGKTTIKQILEKHAVL
ncbi:MAG: plasmid maintenance system antidote protein [Chryseobacterium sp.]|nr:MAG: plasmid maintenance system antidote protein [Chryseobacterium sp.]